MITCAHIALFLLREAESEVDRSIRFWTKFGNFQIKWFHYNWLFLKIGRMFQFLGGQTSDTIRPECKQLSRLVHQRSFPIGRTTFDRSVQKCERLFYSVQTENWWPAIRRSFGQSFVDWSRNAHPIYVTASKRFSRPGTCHLFISAFFLVLFKTIFDKVLQLIKERPNICSHIHLPAQSGNNEMLEAMGRGYTREAYLELVANVRNIIPGKTLKIFSLLCM